MTNNSISWKLVECHSAPRFTVLVSISSMQKAGHVAERLLVYAKFISLLSTQRQHVKFNYSFWRMTATREGVNARASVSGEEQAIERKRTEHFNGLFRSEVT